MNSTNWDISGWKSETTELKIIFGLWEKNCRRCHCLADWVYQFLDSSKIWHNSLSSTSFLQVKNCRLKQRLLQFIKYFWKSCTLESREWTSQSNFSFCFPTGRRTKFRKIMTNDFQQVQTFWFRLWWKETQLEVVDSTVFEYRDKWIPDIFLTV